MEETYERKIHELKCWPPYYRLVECMVKQFEVRKADRDFAVNDLVRLMEYDPDKQKYTGRYFQTRIRYILPGGQFGIEEGYCVLGF